MIGMSINSQAWGTGQALWNPYPLGMSWMYLGIFKPKTQPSRRCPQHVQGLGKLWEVRGRVCK